MLNKQVIEEIRNLVQDFWEQEVRQADFISMAAGKEIGHRIADSVDERTTNLLRGRYDTRFEYDASGSKRPRSMGDIWLKFNGIFHPINVKAGEFGSSGQPNMTAMGKLLESLLTRQIDSYYLLIVKFSLPKSASAVIVPTVYFVDMLEYLVYMTFNSGPGQIMMQEAKFYPALSSGVGPSQIPLEDKIARLFAMLEVGERLLIVNRERRLKKLEGLHTEYKRSLGHTVEQSGLNLR